MERILIVSGMIPLPTPPPPFFPGSSLQWTDVVMYNSRLFMITRNDYYHIRLLSIHDTRNGYCFLHSTDLSVHLPQLLSLHNLTLRSNYWSACSVMTFIAVVRVFSNDISKAMSDYLTLPLEDVTSASLPMCYISFPSAKDPTWDQRHAGRWAPRS